MRICTTGVVVAFYGYIYHTVLIKNNFRLGIYYYYLLCMHKLGINIK